MNENPFLDKIIKCCECKQDEKISWNHETNEELIKYNLCFTCNFWRRKVDIAHFDSVARINGTHYRIVNYNENSEGGFGGRHFKIAFDDGRVVETTNLWCQGEIPEIWKARLPDNANFIFNP